MLSIGKLAAAQATYYLDQAEARVDVVDSVADGMEDYYLGAPEARGEWLGRGARDFGLSGAVEADAIRRVLAGLDPLEGLPLRETASRVRLAGFDLTFSAPKSASVLFGIGDDLLQTRVRVAHDRAVRQALGYLERNAAAVRRGRGGAVVEEASGLLAAAFRHRTSRAGDPQLHTHVLVANLGLGPDGRWSALDGRRLYAHARAASFVYQAVLRAELTRTGGVEWTSVHDGIAEIRGVPLAVRRAFSRRRVDIEAALESRGHVSPRAAEAAALATRRAKDKTMTAEGLVGDWRARASELGFGRNEIGRVIGRATRRHTEADSEALWRLLAGPSGLTRRRATFSRRDVIQAMCELLPSETVADGRALEEAADAFLASAYVVALIPGDDAVGESFRRRDGRRMLASGEVVLYSTLEQLALEQRLIDRAVGSRKADAGVASDRAVRRAVERRPTLTTDQRALVERACLDGDLVAVITVKAGSGKTFALAAAREAWQASGHAVLGVAVARRAASELRDGAGIESTSVAALLRDLRRGPHGLPAGAVLVVDEAGMVPTRDVAALLDHVEQAGGKLVFVGDDRQLPELAAGGTLRALARRGLAIELNDNVRQVHRWEREALDALRDGRVDQAVVRYEQRGRITVAPDEEQTRRALVADWLAAADSGDAVMIAHRRTDVAELNELAREEIRRRGELSAAELSLPGGSFAVGDWVVLKRNESRLGVNNGDRGRVTAVDPVDHAMTVDVGGRERALDAAFLANATRDGGPTLAHGYAITGHIAQGMTVDHAFVLADDGVNAEWAYVALSRGRYSNQLYLSERRDDARAEFAPTDRDPPDPIARLTTSLRGSAAQVLAIDQGRPAAEPSSDRMLGLQAALMTAERRRREREAGRLHWLPGPWGLTRAVRDEVVAREALDQAVRRRAEREHSARPFVTEREQEDEMARPGREAAERSAQRSRERRRGFGRDL